jgi:hypothetical protein
MDHDQLDALTCTFRKLRSRPGVLMALSGGLLTLLTATFVGQPAVAGKQRSQHAVTNKKRHKQPCPPCKTRKHGKCKGRLPDGSACAEGTCQSGICVLNASSSPPPASPPPPSPPPGPTCTDGIRNGSESDVDCGGSCPRCADFQTCDSRSDCRSALCVADVCRVCNRDTPGECGSDALGACTCLLAVDGQLFCGQASAVQVNTCSLCPAGTTCVTFGTPTARCFKPCGAS